MIILSCIGNDIVDLNAPEARGKSGDRRFMGKTLTIREREAIRRTACPDSLLWAFWAARETAYKAISKIYPDVSFSPRRYDVALGEMAGKGPLLHPVSGMVYTPKGRVPVRVLFHPDYIHCIGGWRCSGLDRMTWGAAAIDEMPGSGGSGQSISERESRAARCLAVAGIAHILACDPEDIRISNPIHKKTSWFPSVYVKGKPAGFDISLSHDGRFAAFAVGCL